MKIKTITCHDVYNFGASLQAYALQTFLQNQGHEVEVIDYRPSYKHFYNFFRAHDRGIFGRIKQMFPLAEPICAMIQHRAWVNLIPMFWRFKSFKWNKLNCTKEHYRSIGDFCAKKPDADLYIAGSDQIWNTAFHNGLDPVYYCMFETNTQKCISYAASFGICDIPEQHQNFVKKGLANFRSISIREQSGVMLAKKMGFDAVHVLDPVFLLTAAEWLSLTHKRHREKYLLVYDFSNKDSRMEQIATTIAKERGLSIYSFNSCHPYIEKRLRTCGPVEFIEWISGANMILSNSFHATAFSIIFKRDFYTLPLLGHENSSRMKDLLEMLGLSMRFIEDVQSVNSDLHVNYEQSSRVLKKCREDSINWLMQSLFYENQDGF